MNFLKRAWKNVIRRKTKSILLLITFFVIGNFVIVGLGISNASETAKVLARQKMRALVTYGIDEEALFEYAWTIEDEEELDKFYKNWPTVNIDTVNSMLSDERVKAANAVSSHMVYGVTGGIKPVKLTEDDNGSGGGEACTYDEEGNEVCYTMTDPDFFVKANFFAKMIEFEDNEWGLKEGRFYTTDEISSQAKVALISTALAQENGLKVGDSFKVAYASASEFNSMAKSYNVNKSYKTDDLSLELEIIGIYEHNSAISRSDEMYEYYSTYENPDNVILMPATTINGAVGNAYAELLEMVSSNSDVEYAAEAEYFRKQATKIEGTVAILLNDPQDVDPFIKDYKDKISEYEIISFDNSEFERLSKPLDTLSIYANFIVWIVVINAIVIITLVVALTLKTREYEIGVLLSIGASKLKVILQFFCELAIVAIIGFSLAVVSGSLMSKSIGKSVLEYQITNEGLNEENEEEEYYYFEDIYNTDYNTEISLNDIVKEYEVSVSPLLILEIYAVGLAIVLVSTLIPSLMIMRFNPKRILMNQG